MNTDAYKKDPLRYILNLAYAQAMTGKGKERHAEDKPFREQIWSVITKTVGLGFPLGQSLKKWDESQRLSRDAAVRELLGSIIYLAMAIITLIDGGEGER